ncbi:MAG: hypothetical protein OJF59_002841 [Cytophagales bacterium]|jgi:hypothetical protein|nr:MAG: hypothetical protein OJF59_002841 [Cytophagales bacterium]
MLKFECFIDDFSHKITFTAHPSNARYLEQDLGSLLISHFFSGKNSREDSLEMHSSLPQL